MGPLCCIFVNVNLTILAFLWRETILSALLRSSAFLKSRAKSIYLLHQQHTQLLHRPYLADLRSVVAAQGSILLNFQTAVLVHIEKQMLFYAS